jgi:hypothetical protein
MFTAIVFLLYRLASFSILWLQEAETADFNDLGKLLLGGVAIAISLAIAFTVLRMKLQSKSPPPPSFISINPGRANDDAELKQKP